MNYQEYSFFLERTFIKGEYISIAKLGAKMLTTPNHSIEKDYRVFLFLTQAPPTSELCKNFVKYALSVKFYDDGTRGRTPVVIPLFVADSFDKSALEAIKKAQKSDGAMVLPCAFELESGVLSHPESLPLLSQGAFKDALKFIKLAITPQTN